MAVELMGYHKPAFDVRFGYLTLQEDIISGKAKITARESCRTLQRARYAFTFYLFIKKRIP